MDFIEPNKELHKYVVGIDFGHGETSAAFCPIQWDDKSTQLKNVQDIEVFPTKFSIHSVLFIETEEDGSTTKYIGEEAENRYIQLQSKKNGRFYAYWKDIPSRLRPDQKEAMILYMKEFYRTIKEKVSELEDNNHLVYIACPSDSGKWNETEKASYAQMALEAGLPLVKLDEVNVGIIRESRAAFIKVRHNDAIQTSVTDGTIVLDCGSSTFDLTYYSKGLLKPIDHSYDTIGAYEYERKLLQWLEQDEKRKENLDTIFNYANDNKKVIELLLRKSKENYYSDKQKDIQILISKSDVRKLTNFSYSDLPGFDECIPEVEIIALLSKYIGEIKSKLVDFRDEYIKGKNLKLVYLTGGSSRMPFIQSVVKEVFKNVRVFPENSPSLTISEGIALTGRADLRTHALSKRLLKSVKIAEADFATSTIESAAENLASAITEKAANAYDSFASSTNDNNLNYLEGEIQKRAKEVSFSFEINRGYSSTVEKISNIIIDELNEVVIDYFPDYNIPKIISNGKFTVEIPTNSMNGLSMMISRSLNEISEGFWEGLGKVAFNLVTGTLAIIGVTELKIIHKIGDILGFDMGEAPEYKEGIDAVTIDFRNKSTILNSSRRKAVKETFNKSRDYHRTELISNIKEQLKKDGSLIVRINESGRSEISKYIVDQIEKARLILN